MNIHPIIVHFPVALLTTYAVLELIRFRWINKQPYWFYVKAVLVILGGLSLLAAYLTGNAAKQLIADQSLRELIAKHELFAKLDIVIFGIVAAGYVLAWVKTFQLPWLTNTPILAQLWQAVVWVQTWITESKLVIVLALLGLICLLITGALGGSVIYGHANDPLTDWIYHLFFSN